MTRCLFLTRFSQKFGQLLSVQLVTTSLQSVRIEESGFGNKLMSKPLFPTSKITVKKNKCSKKLKKSILRLILLKQLRLIPLLKIK
jgi:hypothetical protein